jgi:hypothetical protein
VSDKPLFDDQIDDRLKAARALLGEERFVVLHKL